MREVVPTGSAVSATSEAPRLPAPERQSSPFVCPIRLWFFQDVRRPPRVARCLSERGPSELRCDTLAPCGLSVSALLLVAGVVVIALPR